MANNDLFNARLDRLKAENDVHTGNAPPSAIPPAEDNVHSSRSFGLHHLVLPVASLLLLGIGAYAFSGEVGGNPKAALDLKSVIKSNMTDEELSALGQNEQIERELKARRFSDPDLARLILSN